MRLLRSSAPARWARLSGGASSILAGRGDCPPTRARWPGLLNVPAIDYVSAVAGALRRLESYNYKLNDGNPNVNDVKSNVDSSLNSLTTNKQNVFTCITPLIKNDISNNIRIDLSAYPLKTNVDSSLNSLSTNKQNVFTCITPLI